MAKKEQPLLDPKMMQLLVCPQTKSLLEYDEKAQELISKKARLAYPVRDGVPILLIEEARPLDE
ncbi:MAG: Trm112 family protein [Rhizobiaceae bacterium]